MGFHCAVGAPTVLGMDTIYYSSTLVLKEVVLYKVDHA